MKLVRLTWFAIGLLIPAAPGHVAAASPSALSRVIEAAGVVEFQPDGANAWRAATNGLALKPGDRLRTGPQSRAAVQFSDRSILRLSERTTLRIQPPRQVESRRFRLDGGSIFFFNREKPSSVEFETPIATAAIRGTEFVLETDEATSATRLALLDGRVDLTTADTTLTLQSGEQASVVPGQPTVKTALIETAGVIQWALYYPAILQPDDLALMPDDQAALEKSLAAYRQGDVIAAHDALAGVAVGGEARELYRAALDLAVGQVEAAEARLAGANASAPVVRALRELIATVRGNEVVFSTTPPQTATEWLARSYSLQARFKLSDALQAARQSVALAPSLGFTHGRVAELELSFERRRAAWGALEKALALAPRLAPARSLRGFVLLDDNDAASALAAFDQAIALDAALGSAWLGRGLAQLRLRDRDGALRSFQTAAALEPRRGVPRGYLGKAFSERGEAGLAAKEFRLAKDLDPGDPTAWLYSALHQWQQNRPNAAVRDLERSTALNDNRRLFRSSLLLDRDRAVRSANLAALYRDAGLPEVSVRSAARAVSEDYANFSGHLFLAQSYQALEDPNRFDLRFETARQSELLVANLLAPAGAANLSQLLSQQEHLQFFEPRPFAVSSITGYRSTGDWAQQASFYGAVKGFSYALDTAFEWRHGQEINDWSERREISFQFKQRVTARDEVYGQVGFADAEMGNVARLYDPANPVQAKAGLRVTEDQRPNVFLGWHRAWSPASHTLLLLSRLTDSLTLRDPQPDVLFLFRSGGNITNVSTPPGFDVDFTSDFTLYSAELQHFWQTPRHTFIVGGRLQAGDVESDATLNRVLSGVIPDPRVDESLLRANAYAYHHWHVAEPLRLVAGLSYDHLDYPLNSELAPLSEGSDSRDRVSPKVGFLLTPWRDGLLRGSYTRSLGGLFFDNSIRLEPAQVAGFNQAYRSLLPESVAGLVPGTTFETVSLGFDQSFRSGTYFGLEAEWLRSEGGRVVGALTNSVPPPVPDSASGTRQTLDFRERSLSAYAVQLVGDGFSVGARYRLSHARFDGRFPEIPVGAVNLPLLEQSERALLHQAGLSLNYQHPGGFFAQWESAWFHQDNDGYNTARPVEDFWQHNLWAGYRLPRRRAELRVGVLNLTDTDYRLNPLNTYANLPRQRTAVVSLRLNF